MAIATAHLPHTAPLSRTPQTTHSPHLHATNAAPTDAALTNAVLYRRRRVLATVAIVIIGAGIWTVASLAIGLFTPQAEADLTPGATYELTETYLVQPGDTLWAIANRYDTDGDVRDTVDRIAAANGGAALTAGQRITIPLEVGR